MSSAMHVEKTAKMFNAKKTDFQDWFQRNPGFSLPTDRREGQKIGQMPLRKQRLVLCWDDLVGLAGEQ